MAISEIRLPPGELTRLAECVLEPIRFPGAVQPHGLLLVSGRDDFVISRVSDNASALIGADPIALLGRGLADLVGAAGVAEVIEILDPLNVASNPARAVIGEDAFDLIVHAVGDSLLIELEPIVQRDDDQIAAMRVSFRRLAAASTVAELWSETAIEVQRVTGFDHVMVYHFHPDEHGEIVAESVPEDMESYLGLHYPASDIPAQARQLYLTKLSRLIVNSGAQPAAMLSDANIGQSDALDMSGAELRAVSPHHLEFMRNMGQVSTFSLSIVRAGRLVGMITCAHRTERRIPYGVREGLEILANQVSLQLGAMSEIDRLSRRDRVREVRSKLLAQVAGRDDIARALLGGEVTLLDLVPAEGALICLGGKVESVGEVPAPEQALACADRVASATGTLDFSSNAVILDFPGVADDIPGFAGLLMRRLGSDGDFVAWFRREVTQTVDWLGDMSPANRLTPLSPRNSFSAWTEEVTGTSLPWDDLAAEASELCRDLDSALLHRAESQLAELALRDALTGLPNRRLFMDRLEQGLARAEPGDGVAVLFIDLDHFKSINDSWGHAAGDEALVEVAAALSASARSADTVARLGGDEFVVLCDNTSAEQAHHIALRMLDAVRAASDLRAEWGFSASVGIALASAGSTASQLLTAADQAMYSAKSSGRDRVVFAS